MKYSVIIPVYNKAKTISESIDSILEQTFKDFEIVVVNDGSTDEIENVLKKYHDIVVVNQVNQGVSVARNTGIKVARGKYICFLDADDIWKSNHLETLNKLIDLYPDVGYYATSNEIHFTNGQILMSNRYLDKISDKSEFLINNLFVILNKYSDAIINTNSMCIKKDILNKNNLFFEKGVKVGEDTDLWYRIALKNSLAISKTTTTCYRRGYSDATKKTFNPYDWIFSKRIDDILKDDTIKEDIKIECIKLLDRYFLNCSRCYMIDKNRKKAKEILKKVNNKKGKTYILTFLFTLMPYTVCKILYKIV